MDVWNKKVFLRPTRTNAIPLADQPLVDEAIKTSTPEITTQNGAYTVEISEETSVTPSKTAPPPQS